MVLNLVSNSLVLSVASHDSEQVGLYQTGLALGRTILKLQICMTFISILTRIC